MHGRKQQEQQQNHFFSVEIAIRMIEREHKGLGESRDPSRMWMISKETGGQRDEDKRELRLPLGSPSLMCTG